MTKSVRVQSKWIVIIVAACVFVSGGNLSAAEESTIQPLKRPDPGSISLPNLVFKPTRNETKFYDVNYYFHKPQVSYETAFADLDQCRIYALTTLFGIAPVPTFALLGTDIASQQQSAPNYEYYSLQYGGIGVITTAILVGAIVEPQARAFSMAQIHRCMTYKGYRRYGTAHRILEQINSGTEAEKFARLALIASGPTPTVGDIAP